MTTAGLREVVTFTSWLQGPSEVIKSSLREVREKLLHGYPESLNFRLLILDVPDPQELAATKQPVLTRFANFIVNPLKEVYKLPPSSLHIFYDQKGDLIAFNRNGGLFLNMR